ncbi:hypothetical protein CYY_002027 [Polysphondylium violaceum]|uniref:Acyl-coenzyme A oxidase n=1 Tax=Polysphondylium violaceum TaxID=133409 RepID=A0A8J4Q0V0_9MYCE|nr:hypothetical protein CYY_002027 [Polysphondylium violaceum]
MYTNRIENIINQIGINECSSSADSLNLNSPIGEVNVAKLKLAIDSPEAVEYKDVARKFIRDNPALFPREHYMGFDWAGQREHVLKQAKSIATNGVVRFADVSKNPTRIVNVIEIFSLYSNNVSTKLGVHYSLFGGTVQYLGTARHQKYMADADRLDILGSFSMTEIGHGSNVRGLETTATYDKQTKEFVINSPTPSSQKFWIGGAGLHGHFTTVFARLINDGKDHGIHAFVVPIRDRATHKVFDGITIKDCGHKMGLNGVDNGQLRFEHVRIPRENLLNKYSDVTEDGVYSSKLSTPIKNFAATMAPFILGRVLIVKGASGASKTCLSIAIRYSFVRKQFGPSLDNEQVLMTLSSQKRRLMVPLANTVIYDIYLHKIIQQLASGKPPASIHAHASGIKAIFSWDAVAAMQTCREACGGQGYRTANLISEFKADCDIICTYEGDNTVLMQQVAKYVLGLKSSDAPLKPFTLDGPAQQLYNLNNLLALFEAREALLASQVKAMIKNSKEKDAYYAFNAIIPFAVKLGHAHMQKEILSELIQFNNKQAVNPIPHLTLLYTLGKIEEDLGYLVSNGLLSPKLAQQLPTIILDLCDQVSKVSKQILESFDIPQNCLPIENLVEDLY